MTCPLPIAVTVINASANRFALAVDDVDGNLLTSLASITRVVLTVGGTTLDSDVVGSSVIWWTDTAKLSGQTVGVIKFSLGGQGLSAGPYPDCRLDMYHSGSATPVTAEVPIKIEVKA